MFSTVDLPRDTKPWSLTRLAGSVVVFLFFNDIVSYTPLVQAMVSMTKCHQVLDEFPPVKAHVYL